MTPETAELNKIMAVAVMGWTVINGKYSGKMHIFGKEDLEWNPAGDDPQSLGQAMMCVEKRFPDCLVTISITNGSYRCRIDDGDMTAPNQTIFEAEGETITEAIVKTVAKAIGKGGGVSELLPCPFCGEDAMVYNPGKYQEPHQENWTVCCVKCNAGIDELDSKEDAVTAWNTRHREGSRDE